MVFALPLLLGNLFQQLYNTVDSIILGNFVGKEALAAVGSTTSLCNLFNREPDVVHYGAAFISMMVPFRFITAIYQCCAGALRGAGDSRGPMFMMLFSFVLVRQAYLLVITRFFHNVYIVAFGYPLGWIVCALLHCLYYHYRRGRIMAHRIRELPPACGMVGSAVSPSR